MSGIIYFLTNEAMPGLIKIGYTCGPINERIDRLSSTGVPISFDIAACFKVRNPADVEKKIHSFLERYRFNKNREFFKISLSIAIETSFPIIVEEIYEITSDNNEPASIEESHGLEKNTVLILTGLADINRNQGYDAATLSHDIGESEIEAINRLANLHDMGLVEEQKSRDEYRLNKWKITSKGIKFIFDNGLVEDYMKKSFW